jgi:hypothetical protein
LENRLKPVDVIFRGACFSEGPDAKLLSITNYLNENKILEKEKELLQYTKNSLKRCVFLREITM